VWGVRGGGEGNQGKAAAFRQRGWVERGGSVRKGEKRDRNCWKGDSKSMEGEGGEGVSSGETEQGTLWSERGERVL